MENKIGICLISTGKYGIFLQPLIDGIEKYFFVNNKIEIYLFTDRQHDLRHSDRISVVNIPTEHKPFPWPTIKRFQFFADAAHLINTSYLFYLDVDMAITGFVDKEILPGEDNQGLVATLHPGFYNGGGSWGDNKDSLSYTLPDLRKKYYAGGFQGGETNSYLDACRMMANNIADDERRGVQAEWHDETHLNQYLSTRTPKTLTPEYCMVEEESARLAWGINHFVPKIVALKKNHEEIRN